MWSEKFTVGEMSVRGNVLVGKFPVGEVSFGELSGRGIVRSGEMSIREVSVGELYAYLDHWSTSVRECLQDPRLPKIKKVN